MLRLHNLIAVTLVACGPAPAGTRATATATSGGLDTTGATTGAPTSTSAEVPTTGMATTTGSSTASTMQPSDFIPHPDVGPPAFECDTFAPNCPPGQKCVPYVSGPDGGFWNATMCVEITGDAATGDPCTTTGGGFNGIDDCSAGSFCWEVDDEGHGTCFAMCLHQGEEFTCPSASSCALGGDAVVGVCIPWCDPLVQNCPNVDYACVPFGSESFDCYPAEPPPGGQFNDPCSFITDCDIGLFCLEIASASSACTRQSTSCCQPFCDYPDGPCPNPDQQCLLWPSANVNNTPGFENVGFCGIPP